MYPRGRGFPSETCFAAATRRLSAGHPRCDGFRPGSRQIEGEAASHAGLGSFEDEPAVIDFGKLPAGVETETGTRHAAECRVFRAMKGLEDSVAVRLGHPDAVVGDVDHG